MYNIAQTLDKRTKDCDHSTAVMLHVYAIVSLWDHSIKVQISERDYRVALRLTNMLQDALSKSTDAIPQTVVESLSTRTAQVGDFLWLYLKQNGQDMSTHPHRALEL
jgi:hypothetical protein